MNEQLRLDVEVKNKISDKMIAQLGSWTCLYPFFEGPEWQSIKNQLKPDITKITPPVDNWFRVFKECDYESLRVVWLGMTPYHTIDTYSKGHVADGITFSTDTKNNVPPSLYKVYKGMEQDLWKGMNLDMERCNKLDFLAHQGILMANAALTTNIGDAKSHLEVWKNFIPFVIEVLNKQKKNLLFVGFGVVANGILASVDRTVHTVIELEHPAASAYEARDWKHENIFSRTNDFLTIKGKGGILWDKYLVDMEVPF